MDGTVPKGIVCYKLKFFLLSVNTVMQFRLKTEGSHDFVLLILHIQHCNEMYEI
jgi:hypothetical protein